MPKQAYFGDHQVKTFKLYSYQRQVRLRSLLLQWQLEKTGATQMENSSNQDGSRTSRFQKRDVFSCAHLGFFFLFSLFFILFFQFPSGLAPPHNWYLKACFLLLFISLATFGRVAITTRQYNDIQTAPLSQF